jgi:cell wall-associated NlpC family hydrolase
MKSKKNIKSILVMAFIGIVSLFFINMSLAANTAKISVETANLREEANENSKILELLSLNDEVEVLEKSGNWYKVKAKGITGYLRGDLISLNEQTEENTNNENSNNEAISTENQEENTENEQNVENNVESSEKNENEEIELGKQKIAEDARLKIVPAINASNTIEVKKDEEVEVIEIINGWICVETGNTKGWIRKEKIKKVEEKAVEEEQKSEEQPAQESVNTVIKTLFVNTTTVNLRKEANTSSEIVTTLPVNTAVDVLEEANGWSKVKVSGKEGYISSSLLSTTKQETSRGAETPRKQEQTSNNVSTSTPASSGNSTSVVEKAKSYIGSKYVYGGMSPNGFDCSGFTSYIYKQFGISLSRTAAGQYSNGSAVNRSELQAGDLVMFGKSGINHVGIYMGGGMMVHAANHSRGVTTDTINSGYYNNNYVGARRVM